MLDWCLTKSYQPDGSFRVSDWMTRRVTHTGTESGFCRSPAISSAKIGFGLTRISLIPKLFKSASKRKLKSTGLNDPALKEAYDTLRAMD